MSDNGKPPDIDENGVDRNIPTYPFIVATGLEDDGVTPTEVAVLNVTTREVRCIIAIRKPAGKENLEEAVAIGKVVAKHICDNEKKIIVPSSFKPKLAGGERCPELFEEDRGNSPSSGTDEKRSPGDTTSSDKR